MKTKTTQKEIKSRFKKIVCVGYADLQHLLSYESPIYHTIRREGWASDIYIFDDIAISTGYAPFGNIKVKYDTKVKKVNKLLEKFLEEVKKKI